MTHMGGSLWDLAPTNAAAAPASNSSRRVIKFRMEHLTRGAKSLAQGRQALICDD